MSLLWPVVVMLPESAAAKARLYWGSDSFPDKISWSNLDGSGGADLNTTGAPVNGPEGLAIDSATGRLYWGDYNPATSEVAYAALDGSGSGGTLNTAGTTMAEDWGLGLDPALGRVYWSNGSGHNLSFASLAGTGGGDLFAGTAASSPAGIAIDAPAGRLYWADYTTNRIKYGNVDGSGSVHQLSTAGATVNEPSAVALDPVTARIYWTNQNDNSIGWARLDGTGGGTLAISSTLLNAPIGLAIDPRAGRLYWGNYGGGSIGEADVSGSDAGLLSTTGATTLAPTFPVILHPPQPAAAPVIAGRRALGSKLSCSSGGWAPDYLGAMFYEQPQHLSYQWTKGVSAIAGATGKAVRASSPGTYVCRVSASNAAGTAVQLSAGHQVLAPPRLTKVTESRRVWRLGNAVPKLVHAASAGAGTAFSFRVSQPSRVTFNFARAGGKRWRATIRVRAGSNRLLFSGRFNSHVRLPTGSYRLTLTARNVAGERSRPHRLTFTITA